MSVFANIGSALNSLTDSMSRANQLRTLSAMSDAQLAARGLKRHQIVDHVFRDIKYL
ncbi:MAG: DUF1127 domain-containing protein [Boseongicola sp.]|nr:DUF1127 domain-containing protein [Boseongicola sp.]